MRYFPFFRQLELMDCGPTCLRMVSKCHGKNFNIETLRNYCQAGRNGVSLLGISNAAEKIGFKTQGVKINFSQLTSDVDLPCILHWGKHHFVVLPPQKFNKKEIWVADPARSLSKIPIEVLKASWLHGTDNISTTGIALLLVPTSKFFEQEGEVETQMGWRFLSKYLLNYKRQLLQLFIGLLLGSLIQLVIPFLTQGIVDTGINMHDLQFIYLILAAQLMLFFGRTVVDFIRSRILLFISTHINISILSDFWMKLMRLPLNFFDTKQTGDILQRINDHQRIQSFLTGSAVGTLFSLFNLIIFSFVLLNYNPHIFLIVVGASILYFSWIKLFLKYRRDLDFKRFAALAKENSATMQLIYGMQEIKLNGAEQLRRWEWEGIQASVFRISFKSLSLSQFQQTGAFFINEGKNIFITFFVAKAVLDGELTLGAMLAIQYIIGQLNGPIEQLIGFTQQAQDAKISLERLNEIHRLEDEEPTHKQFNYELPSDKSITLTAVSFTYPGAGNECALNDITLHIPEGKVTAIVGMSGSGKTTLLKVLLRFYEYYTGEVSIGESNLRYISPRFWRKQCGSVMQDGYIFNDSIAKNIAVGDETSSRRKLLHAAKVANILSFIESLPLGFNTLLGSAGAGISQGQKQRILIARAVYKDPHYIFFDEATNSLDANNETMIMQNMQEFFEGRTVIVIAHRLSTVKHADNIVVLERGQIIEQGTHEKLSIQKGAYYELVKNQLELGN
ncbi:MAG: transporter ATP-binding protein [Chitinophagaceae bacterium]|nr:transporter ATP-binding protein [Chitinophagaceae bacterium]